MRDKIMLPFDPDAIKHLRQRRFYDYWRSKQRGNMFPGRADINPIEFTWALGYVSLYDALSSGDFRCRLDATNTAEFFGSDLTGTLLSTHRDKAMSAMMAETFAQVVRTRAPLLHDRDFLMHNRVWRYQALILPFADDGKTIDMLASILIYGDGGD